MQKHGLALDSGEFIPAEELNQERPIMTNPTPHGQVPAIQRYKIGYRSDEWGMRSSTPSGIPDASGSWVRYEDHVTALAAGQATAAQPAPTYKDSTPELHIGDSAFESWYSTYSPAHKSDKQRARDAYAAGMGDPLVTAAPAAVAGPSAPVSPMAKMALALREKSAAERNDFDRRVQSGEWGAMPEPSTEADALPNHVAEVKGDDAIRILRWSNRVGAFDYPVGTKLYATPTQQARWRMVPLKPSHGMVEAAWATGTEAGGIQDIEDAWTAMLAAAPQPSPTAQAAESVPVLPDFDTVEQHIYGACRRYITRDMLEPIHSLIRDAIDADRAARAPADSVPEDAARLEFLIETRAYVVSDPDACPGYWLHYVASDGATWVQMSDHPTPRAAIDAAIDAARKQGGAT